MANKKTITVDDSVAAAMDANGDGHISAEEMAMDLEFKRKRLEDQDAMRDAQRNMAWFALFGMLLYPFAVVLAVLAGLDQAATVLGSMAPTYFVSVAAIVAAFYAKEAVVNK
jgi:predicted DsbA family dithiol-disulfide isomerase|tara:strand:+ start:147 stop:482 length:336 start_codon:yes stop_codon:yes gene_type:complete